MRATTGLSEYAAAQAALRSYLSGATNARERRFVSMVLWDILQNELTPLQRQYVLLYYERGMTTGEIAAHYRVNRSSVSRALESARTRIQKPLQYVLLALRRARELDDPPVPPAFFD